MKKLAMAMMLGVAALSANAQVNYRMQTACKQERVKEPLPVQQSVQPTTIRKIPAFQKVKQWI